MGARAVARHLGVRGSPSAGRGVVRGGRGLRAGHLDEEVALAEFDEAAALRQELVVPDVQHLSIAMGLRHRIRVLDGLYVALAQQRQAPLVTTDARFAGAQLPVDVRWPGAGKPEQRQVVHPSALAWPLTTSVGP